MTTINPGNFYFFQATGPGNIANTGGGTPFAAIGAASIPPTVAGANAAIWSGGPHVMTSLFSYGSITPVTAIFWWSNDNQQFKFWFRGFPDPFQTLIAGIERGKHYFFQAPTGLNILMD